MKKLWTATFWLFVIFACGGTLWQFLQSDAFQKMNEPISPSILPQSSPRAVGPALSTATETPEPTATQDYGATATQAQAQIDSAQAEAMAAQAAANSAQATANALLQSQIQVTQQAQQIVINAQAMTATSGYWTANAPATPTPNATATAEHNLAVIESAKGLQAVASQVAEAPTQIVRSAIAQAQAQNADFDHKAATIAPFFIGILILIVLILGAWVVWNAISMRQETGAAPVEDPKPEPPQWFPQDKQVTHIKARSEDGNENWRHEIPCTPEAWEELCIGVMRNHISLAINNWEGSKSPFTRNGKNSFKNVLRWMQANSFCRPKNTHTLKTSDKVNMMLPEGEQFMLDCLELGTPPPQYIFNPDAMQNTLTTPHDNEYHDHEEAVGELILTDYHPIPQKETN